MAEATKPATRPPRDRLFGPAAVAAHTVLFTPLVGGALAAINWRRAGRPDKARSTAVVAVATTAALVLLAALLPESAAAGLRGAVSGGTIALAFVWFREQRSLFEAHVAAGGAKASAVPATFAGLALVGVVLGALVLADLRPAADREFEAGLSALNAERFGEAETHFRAALAQGDEDPAIRFNLAMALARQGRREEARRELVQLVDAPGELAVRSRAVLELLDVADAQERGR